MEPLDLVTGPAASHFVRTGAGLPLPGRPRRLLAGPADRGHRRPRHRPAARIPEEWAPALARRDRGAARLRRAARTTGRWSWASSTSRPDSFSGDGLAGSAEAAIARGHAMLEAGADLLDIGGEIDPARRRPGRRRRRRCAASCRWCATSPPRRRSPSTRATPPPCAAALEAGARDRQRHQRLRHDPAAMARGRRARGAGGADAHARPRPARRCSATRATRDVALEVAAFLRERVEAAERAGIPRGADRGRPRHRLRQDDGAQPRADRAAAAAGGHRLPHPPRRLPQGLPRPPLRRGGSRAAAPPRASPPRSPPPRAAPPSCACTTWRKRSRRCGSGGPASPGRPWRRRPEWDPTASVRRVSDCTPATDAIQNATEARAHDRHRIRHHPPPVRHRRHPRHRQHRAHGCRDRAAARPGGRAHLQPRRPPPSRGDRQGHPAVRLHAGAGAHRRLHRHRHGRGAGRPAADAGHRPADALASAPISA